MPDIARLQLQPVEPEPDPRFPDGIEYFYLADEEYEGAQCARCGSSVAWLECWNCGGEVYVGHDCGEDCCCCLYPEDNVVCDVCRGTRGRYHCLSSPEWCQAHPMPGRENVQRLANKCSRLARLRSTDEARDK